MSEHGFEALQRVLQKVGATGFARPLARCLSTQREAVDAELTRTVMAEVPAFAQSGNPEIGPAWERQAAAHGEQLLRLVAGGRIDGLEYVVAHGRAMAEQRFPLAAMLHAYRCAQKIYLRWLRDAVLELAPAGPGSPDLAELPADLAIEYLDAVSRVFATGYSNHQRVLTDVAGDPRARLLSLLLEGYDESDPRVAGVLRNAGFLDQRRAFCVVLARPADPAEMGNPARARRLVDSIDHALLDKGWRRLIDVRDERAVLVVSDIRRASGWSAPRRALAERLVERLQGLGTAVLIGISDDVPSTAHIPRAYRKAEIALDLADVGHRVVPFSGLTTLRLAGHLAGDELSRLVPPWRSGLHRAERRMRGVLLPTLRACAAADMNILKTAEMLNVHANTVYHRLRVIENATGVDAKSFHGLAALLLVADDRRS